MLFAVEGGGFFSASASGYSNGLTVLLLGQTKEKLMRVSPWNDYQLDQESTSDNQLASTKKRLVHHFTPFVCFGCTASGVESPPPLKVGPTQLQDVLPGHAVSEKGSYDIVNSDPVKDDDNEGKIGLKSNLKKPRHCIQEYCVADDNECKALGDKDGDVPGHTKERKVQWTDASGGELVEVREFEPSETDESDDEFDRESERNCSCRIM